MKLVSNTGRERVIDLIRQRLKPGQQLDMATPALSGAPNSLLLQQLVCNSQALSADPGR
jgi:hypothetical protein